MYLQVHTHQHDIFVNYQVRVRCPRNSISLSERLFRPAIRDNNYGVDSHILQFRLSLQQATDLIAIFERVAAEEGRIMDVPRDNLRMPQEAIPLPLAIVVRADPIPVTPIENVSEEGLVRVTEGVEGQGAGGEGGEEDGRRPWAEVWGNESVREVPRGRCFGTTANMDREVEGVETEVSMEQFVTR